MKSLKALTRKGVIVSTTALSALALASCSAGQITQTSTQVAAVDGAPGETSDGKIAVRDVTIQVEPKTGKASLKFVAANQGYADEKYDLEGITVDGKPVQLGNLKPIGRDQSIVADSPEKLKSAPQTEDNDTQYVAITLENDDFGFAGSRPVTFQFSNEALEVDAAISAPQHEAGSKNRDVTDGSGYTTETAPAEAEH